MVTHPIVDRISEYNVKKALADEPPFRNHLGGSMIGGVCERDLWYNFRWTALPSFDGRMYRLFDRGHKEEFRFVEYLRGIGLEVQEYSERLMHHPESDSYMTTPWRDFNTPPADPEIEALCNDVTGITHHMLRAEEQGVALKQWRIAGVDGHFGGSLDGKAATPQPIQLDVNEVLLPGEKILLEFKTHNTKSFTHLVTHKVKEAKPVHWFQMQTYMYHEGLTRALYMAVNKNDDDLYCEVVHLDPSVGPEMIAKAERVIWAKTPPQRVGRHPSWHECKFCDHARVCHYGDPMHKTCRSCVNAEPIEKGQWRCNLWNAIIPSDAMLKGCDSYKMITD